MQIDPVPAFRDNYIWLMHRDGQAIVVDPGDAAPVARVLAERGLHLGAIVVTHHHADHVGGVNSLVQSTGATVYGPAHSPFPNIDRRLKEGDRIELLGLAAQVYAVPGHTLDHIAYWLAQAHDGAGALFCGDTMFACGCGRLFEGTAAQMNASLSRIAAFPQSALAYCAHEYTASNIRFALAVEPGNAELRAREQDCAKRRDRGEPTVPSTIALEKATNPFLRCTQPEVRAAIRRHAPGTADDEISLFGALRAWKDSF